MINQKGGTDRSHVRGHFCQYCEASLPCLPEHTLPDYSGYPADHGYSGTRLVDFQLTCYHEALPQCCFNVVPTSKTAGQH